MGLMSTHALEEYQIKRPIYERFCEVVRGIVLASFQQSNIRAHSIDARAKELDSFAKKCALKNEDGTQKYLNPLDDVTDLAGVRIIVYTIDDIEVATRFLDENFSVIEKRDVGEERIEKGEFGYQSVHYLVRLSDTRLGLPDFAGYSDLVCEIQVRTVLQHAWAEMEHDIQYKGSQNIPKAIRRKFLSLAGLLEIADREFSSIQRYDKELKRGVLSELTKDLTKDAISQANSEKMGTAPSQTRTNEKSSKTRIRDLVASGRYDEAIDAYTKKIELEPKDYTLFVGRSRTYFLSGESEKALEDVNEAIKLQPDNEDAINLKARIEEGSTANIPVLLVPEYKEKLASGDKALRLGKAEDAYVLYSDALRSGASRQRLKAERSSVPRQ